jgi:DNA-binding LacI/PurR family transcriptional regulator
MTTPSTPSIRALTQMRTWLQQGTLDGGAGLPAELELAERLAISRGTMRKVLQQLASEGLIQPRTRGRRIQPARGDQERVIVVLGSGLDDQGLDESAEGSVEDACGRALRGSVHPLLLIEARRSHPERALSLLGHPPAGVVCTQFVAEKPAWLSEVARWRQAGIPVVVHGSDPAYAAFDRVHSDHAGAAYELTRQLLATGRRRIRQVWPSAARPYWLQEREAGHARAMAEAGLTVATPLHLPDEPPRSPRPDQANLDMRVCSYLGFLHAALQGNETPDALIAVNDIHTVAVALACRRLGRAVHDDIAVCGFDAAWQAAWEWQGLDVAPFRTCHKHNHTVGQALAGMLLARIAGRLPTMPQVTTMPITVVSPGT